MGAQKRASEANSKEAGSDERECKTVDGAGVVTGLPGDSRCCISCGWMGAVAGAYGDALQLPGRSGRVVLEEWVPAGNLAHSVDFGAARLSVVSDRRSA